ncbi:hypothetical protein TTHERM_00935440 (macronuclear) [Tetrahymena thermophila SB210]|uniref:Transmembrane protein n=1 Tax=Tetrahymena thermophila (strain SB210) TaxID=312017 RepID=Q23UJ0_TETTS|nr:hypothetical protein TTHERM_00935440 [Tetrahymena thermophila SB210]EAS00168.2 hypothetical protein TTHERM_00935440 [Tetrahymena thermophila SB210]|eukprot:XP_001020413.2 hypothetical protein TTHERM_00935440 [Tetrahymena thermophila SB210]
MKFFAFALLALIAISFVSAQSKVDLNSNTKMFNCINNVKNPCQPTDNACLAEYTKISDCTNKCHTDNATTFSTNYMSCAKKCTSTNKDVQTYYDAIIVCLNLSILCFLVI